MGDGSDNTSTKNPYGSIFIRVYSKTTAYIVFILTTLFIMLVGYIIYLEGDAYLDNSENYHKTTESVIRISLILFSQILMIFTMDRIGKFVGSYLE